MKRFAFAALTCLAMAAQAAPTLSPNLNQRLAEPYASDVFKATPALSLNILGLLGEEATIAPWMVKGFKTGNMVVTPIKSFESGKTVVTGTFCEPHNCGNTQWLFVYEPQSQALLLQQGSKTVLVNAAGGKVKAHLLRIAVMARDLDSMSW